MAADVRGPLLNLAVGRDGMDTALFAVVRPLEQ
jgi:hypothetical protein